jgi:hypothetical protein
MLVRMQGRTWRVVRPDRQPPGLIGSLLFLAGAVLNLLKVFTM